MLVRGIYAWTLPGDSHAHGVEKLKTPAIHFNFYSEIHPSLRLDCFVSSAPLSVSLIQSEAEESQLQLASSSFRSGITCDILFTHSRKTMQTVTTEAYRHSSDDGFHSPTLEHTLSAS